MGANAMKSALTHSVSRKNLKMNGPKISGDIRTYPKAL